MAPVEALLQKLPERLRPYLPGLSPLFEPWLECLVNGQRQCLPAAVGDTIDQYYSQASGEFKGCLEFAGLIVGRVE